MNARRRLRYSPLPALVYLLGFFTVAITLFALVGWWMLERMDEIHDVAQTTIYQSAQREVDEALVNLHRDIDQAITAVSEWNETHQQFTNPTYYIYWRENRARHSGLLPDYITHIELYDRQGETLLAGQASGPMPNEQPAFSNRLVVEQGTPFLYRFEPIFEPGSRSNILGYIGLRGDYLTALKQLYRFTRTDVDTLHVLLPEGEHVAAEQAESVMVFSPVELDETDELQTVMRQTLYTFAVLAAILLATAYLMVISLIHLPLRRLIDYINQLRDGSVPSPSPALINSLRVSEFESLRLSLNDYQVQLNQMHNRLDRKNRELWQLAHHDTLTGVPNRRAYEEEWQELLSMVKGRHIPLSVMLIDCDHFKAINDSYGHDVGDKVIQSVAQCISTALRRDDQLYRIGGDEFAVHLPNTTIESAERLGHRFIKTLADYPFDDHGIKEPVRFSIGLACAYGDEPEHLAKLHKYADIAMYRAKGPGHRKVLCYDQQSGNDDTSLSSRTITTLYRAIEQGEGITLHFQPVWPGSEKCQGFFEVLARLSDDEGMLLPGDFFPVINSEGIASEFDFAILHRLVAMIEAKEIPTATPLSVNLDGMTLLHHDLFDQLEPLTPHLADHPIILEVTETALITDLHEAGSRLNQLREAGYRIALDDFGSGYSSIRYLSKMPVDIVKFDIDMTRDLLGSGGQRIVVEDIANMILKAGYELVAEGIENEALLQRCRQMGFSYLQGFLLGRPGDATTLEKLGGSEGLKLSPQPPGGIAFTTPSLRM